MAISQTDWELMKEVAKYFDSTRKIEDPKAQYKLKREDSRSLNDTAVHFGITRAKVMKMLITMGAYETQMSRDVQELRRRGMSVKAIAEELGVSIGTVSSNLPYEEEIHGGDSVSDHALAMREYRAYERMQKERQNKMKGKAAESNASDRPYPGGHEAEWGAPKKEPSEHQKITHLHLELYDPFLDEEDMETLRSSGGVQGYAISRDVIVPPDIPLYALHFVIQRVFGWQNSHLHTFHLLDERLKEFCEDSPEQWRQMVGIVFRSPRMSEEAQFWADDYESGSFKNWLRSKYTGPYLSQCRDEGLYSSFYDVQDIEFNDHSVDKLFYMFGSDPFALLERLPIESVLCTEHDDLPEKDQATGQICRNVTEELSFIDPAIDAAFRRNEDSPFNQVLPKPFATELLYTYDFGDNWCVRITANDNCMEMVEEGIVNRAVLDKAINKCRRTYRPVLIARDGEMVMDDVGGLSGFAQFLRDINPETDKLDERARALADEQREEMLDWARSQGWKKNDASNMNLL